MTDMNRFPELNVSPRFPLLLHDEEACRDYLRSRRYPGGFVCGNCGGRECWTTAREYLHCARCGAQVSLRSGTLFQGSKKPLSLWFRGLYLFVSLKSGITARDLRSQLGLSSYQTAWAWLARIREGARTASCATLSGTVEIDQLFYPQPGGGDPVAIAVAVERGARNRIGSVRMEPLKELSSSAMNRFLRDTTAAGSLIHCDGWNLLSDPDYRYDVSEKRDPEELLPSVRLAAGQFRQRLSRSHPGPVDRRQIGRYIGEFQFRFNFRKERNSGVLFDSLLSGMVTEGPRTFGDLTGV